uniref:Uncharacterized protein n=1 Tax=Ananas comosus var. bracteatus TaxID=296719 RepID=A0A6V7PR06_ANACO|nr:unnamed protein product [Ananas comosus var. bracteatus]
MGRHVLHYQEGGTAALASSSDKGKNLDDQAEVLKAEEVSLSQIKPQQSDASGSIVEQMNRISISEVPVEVGSFTDSAEVPKDRSSGPDLDKRIRALKKKIRLAEALLQGEHQNMMTEQLDKMRKMEGWREELKILEDRKSSVVS